MPQPDEVASVSDEILKNNEAISNIYERAEMNTASEVLSDACSGRLPRSSFYAMHLDESCACMNDTNHFSRVGVAARTSRGFLTGGWWISCLIVGLWSRSNSSSLTGFPLAAE